MRLVVNNYIFTLGSDLNMGGTLPKLPERDDSSASNIEA
jgi:hypothetical protein